MCLLYLPPSTGAHPLTSSTHAYSQVSGELLSGDTALSHLSQWRPNLFPLILPNIFNCCQVHWKPASVCKCMFGRGTRACVCVCAFVLSGSPAGKGVSCLSIFRPDWSEWVAVLLLSWISPSLSFFEFTAWRQNDTLSQLKTWHHHRPDACLRARAHTDVHIQPKKRCVS